MKWNLFCTPSHLGVAVCSGRVSMAKICRDRRGYLLEQAVSYRIPDNWLAAGQLNTGDLLCAFMKEKVQVHGWVDLPTVMSLPASIVQLQTLHMPGGLSDNDIYADLSTTIEREGAEAGYVDFARLPQENLTETRIITMSIRQAYVKRYVDCMTSAGLSIKIVDVDRYALLRVLALDQEAVPVGDTVYLLLYVIDWQLTVMAYDCHGLCIYQSVEVCHDDIDSFIERLSLFIQGLPTRLIEKIIVCAGNAEKMQQALRSLPYPSYSISVLSLFNLAAGVDVATIAAEELVIACGLAMRQVPAWL